ncbi:MAG: hypothetical protein QXT81_02100 [Candidatus Bathyarchaeia archaeon]
MPQRLDDKTFIDEALRIVREAEKNGAVLRIIGALAVRLHCPEYATLHVSLKRLEEDQSFTDIDLIGYSGQMRRIREVMEDILRFKISPQALLMRGKERLVYTHPEDLYQVDVFLDRLRFSHDIAFGKDPKEGRLSLDFPTITPTDILLEKIQIHDIAEKDIKDILTILRAHSISLQEEKDRINAAYIARLLAGDWGFWYDAKLNLAKAQDFARRYRESGMLTQHDLEDITGKIAELTDLMDKESKTREWVKASRRGLNKQWWRSVEELIR